MARTTSTPKKPKTAKPSPPKSLQLTRLTEATAAHFKAASQPAPEPRRAIAKKKG